MVESIKISAVIIAFNEEENIGRCLQSVTDVVDEIVVVDSNSTDRTREICRHQAARVIQHSFTGHVEQKNYAMQQAANDFILSLDADEVLSDDLKQSIQRVKHDWEFDGYAFNRLTNYCGRWIRHSGWYPDRKLRLWDRRKGRWGGVNPHDRVQMGTGCRVHPLDGDLLHFSYPTIEHHIAQNIKFAGIAARSAFANGETAHLMTDIVLNPPLTFLKKYFLKLGVLDGYAGFMIAVHTAYGKFLKYIRLRELNRDGLQKKQGEEL